jgi:hypothetical protein
MFDPDDPSSQPRLVFRPEKLREVGIPDSLIEAAAKSDSQDSFYPMTCRIRRSQQPALPNDPQRKNPQLKSGGARCTRRRKTQWT